jgi:hypothetical protein
MVEGKISQQQLDEILRVSAEEIGTLVADAAFASSDLHPLDFFQTAFKSAEMTVRSTIKDHIPVLNDPTYWQAFSEALDKNKADAVHFGAQRLFASRQKEVDAAAQKVEQPSAKRRSWLHWRRD